MPSNLAVNIAIMPSTTRPKKSEDQLWKAYRIAKDEAATTDLVVHYHGLVVSLARARLKCLPDTVPLQDLVAAAMAGLYDAIGKFKESAGVPFKSYASIRIRGAIVDWLRVTRPVPRAVAYQKIDFVEISKFDDILMDTRRGTEDIVADNDEIKVLLARVHREQRRILKMRFLDNFLLIELAAIYNISESAACLRIKHALAKAREFAGRRSHDELSIVGPAVYFDSFDTNGSCS